MRFFFAVTHSAPVLVKKGEKRTEEEIFRFFKKAGEERKM